MKLFDISFEEIQEQSVEEENVPKKSQTETELVIYCKISYFEGLKEAVKKERQDQYEIKSANDKTGSKGCVRIRKTTDSDGVKFVLTNKVRTEDNNLSISEEFNIDITEEHFNGFAKICSKKTIKDRFIFLSKNVTINQFGESSNVIEVPELKFEVDVFPKEEGGYHEWCKIDIEIDPLLKVIDDAQLEVKDFKLNIKVNHLPFKPVESFVGSEANEEQKKIMDTFYQSIFVADN